MICTLEKLHPKMKGGRVDFVVRESTCVETECLPVIGRTFSYQVWGQGKCMETGTVKQIERGTGTPYAKTYRFVTKGQTWRITITDPIFAGT